MKKSCAKPSYLCHGSASMSKSKGHSMAKTKGKWGGCSNKKLKVR